MPNHTVGGSHDFMKSMIEFFSGSGKLAEAFDDQGYHTCTIDNNPNNNPDLVIDILNLEINDLPGPVRNPDVIHFGVPCTKFSVAGKETNFTNFMPNDIESCIALALVYKCLELIQVLNPKSWFIENPMGYLRKFPFMKRLPRKEIWYCQYGDTKAKPTDFWTNRVDWIPKKCFNENPNCKHERAPRGCNTGTQGMSNAYERGIYPEKLCMELVNLCEGKLKIKQEVLSC